MQLKTITPFVLLTCLNISQTATAQTNNSDHWTTQPWEGHISLPNGQKMPMALELFAINDGITGNMISPAQMSFVNPVDNISIEGQTLRLRLPTLGATLSLKQGNSDCSEGKLSQGIELAVKLCKTKALTRPVKPQTPTRLNYTSEDLSFSGGSSGVTLSGTLTLPKNVSNPPLIVLTAGSGPSDRDGDVYGHQPYLVLADMLTRQGFAVYRYDKRGVKRSTGSFSEATVEDFTKDLVAIIQQIKFHPMLNGSKIGVAGHSEGGSIAADAVTRAGADFVISLAGIGLSGMDSLLLQDGTESAAKGASPEDVDKIRLLAKGYYTAIMTATPEQQKTAAEMYIAQLSETDKAFFKKWSAGAYTLELKNAGQTGWVSLLKMDPTPIWQKVMVPMLVINGDKDVQVPSEPHLNAIKKATKENSKVTIVELKNVNHMLQTATDGDPKLYSSNAITIEPDLAPVIKNWFTSSVRL